MRVFSVSDDLLDDIKNRGLCAYKDAYVPTQYDMYCSDSNEGIVVIFGECDIEPAVFYFDKNSEIIEKILKKIDGVRDMIDVNKRTTVKQLTDSLPDYINNVVEMRLSQLQPETKVTPWFHLLDDNSQNGTQRLHS